MGLWSTDEGGSLGWSHSLRFGADIRPRGKLERPAICLGLRSVVDRVQTAAAGVQTDPFRGGFPSGLRMVGGLGAQGVTTG